MVFTTICQKMMNFKDTKRHFGLLFLMLVAFLVAHGAVLAIINVGK